MLISPTASEPDPTYYQRMAGEWPLFQRTEAPVTVQSLQWSKQWSSQNPFDEQDEIRDSYADES